MHLTLFENGVLGNRRTQVAENPTFEELVNYSGAAGAGPSRTQAGQVSCESVMASSGMANPITGISPTSTLPVTPTFEEGPHNRICLTYSVAFCVAS
jgi:hypothetical protein